MSDFSTLFDTLAADGAGGFTIENDDGVRVSGDEALDIMETRGCPMVAVGDGRRVAAPTPDTRMVSAGDRVPTLMPYQAGDIEISFGGGRVTVSNRYDDWQVVPPTERTTVERVRAAVVGHPGDPQPDADGWVPHDETLAWDLLLAVSGLTYADVADGLDRGDWTYAHLAELIAAKLDARKGTP